MTKRARSLFDEDHWLDLQALYDMCETEILSDHEALQLGIYLNSVDDPEVMMGILSNMFDGEYGEINSNRVMQISFVKVVDMMDQFDPEFLDIYFSNEEEGLEGSEEVSYNEPPKDIKELN